MNSDVPRYQALISSDWNQCLAPCGPFDPIVFNHPQIEGDLQDLFRRYTANRIPLGDAVRRIGELLPGPLTIAQMEAYLDSGFVVYPGVAQLMNWCRDKGIAFMINTTGMMGYFQRVLAKGLLSPLQALSAHPLVRYPAQPTDPPLLYCLHETGDKASNTAATLEAFGLSGSRTIVIGDSGGDGPHFEWASRNDALLIASMAKPSLLEYCRRHAVRIDHLFGVTYRPGQSRDAALEMRTDFMELAAPIEAFLAG